MRKEFKLIGLLIAVLLWSVTLPTGCDLGGLGTISGTVTLNGEPLEGFSVLIDGYYDNKYVETDAEGKFSCKVGAYGYYFVSPQLSEDMAQKYISVPSYYSVKINMEKSNAENLSFDLTKRYLACSGKIMAGGKPVQGVFLVLDGKNYPYIKKTIATNVNGEYLIEGLEIGAYEMIPILKGYAFTPESATIEIMYDDVEQIDFEAKAINDPEPCWNACYDTELHGGSLEDLNGYASITGDLIIQNTPLRNLTALEHLKTIEGSLQILDNPFLSSLEGLSILTLAEDMRISGNDALTDLSGLDHLSSSKKVTVSENDALESLEGFSNFTAIRYLNISGNDHLESLSGLDSLTSVSSIDISENTRLTTLKGMENFPAISSLSISGNDSLTTLEHLGNLEISRLYIQDNNALTTLEGLYPNRTVVEGFIHIEGNDRLASLKGLDHITSIERLFISDQPLLTNLSLGNLSSIGRLSLSGDFPPGILQGLGKLTTINQDLSISDNSELTTLEGLNNTIYIGELSLSGNKNLIGLTGLDHVSTIGTLYLNSNHALKTLDGLESVSRIEHDIRLHNNDALTSLEGLYNVDYVGGDIYIILTDLNLWWNSSKNSINESLSQADVTNLVNHIGASNIKGGVETVHFRDAD